MRADIYERITLTDGTAFYLNVTAETATFLHGWEVDKEGVEIVPRGYSRRMRVISKDLIKRRSPYHMDLTYATLVRGKRPEK